MWKTTLMLPVELKERAHRIARKQGISFGELMRRSLETMLEREEQPLRETDPFFADREVFEGDGPSDLAERHDDYLYGEDY